MDATVTVDEIAMGMGWLGRVSHNPLPDYLCKNGEGDLSACYPQGGIEMALAEDSKIAGYVEKLLTVCVQDTEDAVVCKHKCFFLCIG